MNSWSHTTGSDSLRNSQLAFSHCSNILDAILRHGGVSEPAGMRVTSMVESARSSLFSKIGWSFVYQKVTGRSIFLKKGEVVVREKRDLSWGEARILHGSV